jgi:Coenzyme PQQ synthesis protein D (PqqD)
MAESRFPKKDPELETEDTAEGVTLRHRRDLWTATLNRPAARIWQACDGETPVAALSRELRRDTELGPEESEELTRRGLADLIRAGLVVSESTSASQRALSRRQLLKVLALVGLPAALLPQVSRAGLEDESKSAAPEEAALDEAYEGEDVEGPDQSVLGTTTTTSTTTTTTTTTPVPVELTSFTID